MDYEKKDSENTAVKTIMRMIANGEISQEVAEKYFPELKESEGERIRRFLIKFVNENMLVKSFMADGFDKDEVLAWLEKQGEQKPAWSEEDERKSLEIKCLIGNYRTGNDEYELCSWIDKLKNRVQPKQEWSEGDKAVLDALIRKLEGEDIYVSPYLAVECLKSLRPQSQWKPSEEQMDALRYVTNFDYGGHKATLVSLYEQLKKLK